MADVPAEVFSFSKRQLQQPAQDRIAARSADDDAAVVAMWSSDRTREAITRYLDALRRRPR
jgi:enoyl-CoA hydratase